MFPKIHLLRYNFEIKPLKARSYQYNLHHFWEKKLVRFNIFGGDFFCRNCFEIKKLYVGQKLKKLKTMMFWNMLSTNEMSA